MLIRIVNRIPKRFPSTLVLVSFVLLIAGCQQVLTGDSGEPDDVASFVNRPPPIEPPINDTEATELMYTISDGSTEDARLAIKKILDIGDERFVAVLIELLRAEQVRIVDNLTVDDYVDALQSMTGQPFDILWIAWVEWYAASDLEPPPGFTTWKGELLARIDPKFAEFLTDDHPADISVEEIQWGGVNVDGIPPLDNPNMVTVAEAAYLEPQDAVFGVAVEDDARAYPLRIMDWHEMANDVVGGVPMSLAYCTLCGAAIAYDTRTDATGIDGAEPITFGTSGLLFRSNKLMYDRQTRTLWNQLSGEPVLGELAGEEVTLDLLPVVLTSWEDWRAQHPETLVLDINTGFGFDYSPGAAYGSYFDSAETVYPVGQRGDQLGSKEQVYALRVNDVPKAYALNTLIIEQVVNDEIAGTPLVLVATGDRVDVAGTSLQGDEVIYTAGAEVRAFQRGEEQFSPGPEEGIVLDSAGRKWQLTEEALVGPDDQLLPRLNGHLSYWFGWYAFFPNTLVYPGE
jgi:hypothetical protein